MKTVRYEETGCGQGYLEGSKTSRSIPARDTITPHRGGILRRIGEGYKNKEIATYLCVSVKTVQRHRAIIMRKLNPRSVSDLAAFAMRKGWVTR
ncbi:MAG: hypothetical protein GTO24_14765 [candidate division Zixibacteria bacterium]|nr:hypothetical protein [candidate division Zixibacteria bacterium]